jgi:AraC-like DNA-binding protein
MYPIGLVRAGFIAPIVAALERAGRPVDRLLAGAGVPIWARGNPDMLIPIWSIPRLLGEGARSQGIENLGLLAGREVRFRFETLGTFGRLIVRSRTLGDALEQVVTNQSTFTSNGRMWLAPRGNEQIEFGHAYTHKFDKFDDGWKQVNDYVLMIMIEIVRLGGGPTWRPVAVDVQTDESAVLRNAEPLAGARLTFGRPSTVITLPRAFLDQPLPRPRVDLQTTDDSIEAWRESAPPRDFVASIVRAVETLSWEGYPDIHRTAEFLGVSVRTLQRRLAEAGITHESLVSRARLETAAAVLEETDTKILDIALDLGYSDHAHFTRAFRRWTGCSPQAYRRRVKECQASSWAGVRSAGFG